MDLFDIVVAKKLSGGGGGGGNPNYVQTIKATAQNPCEGIDAYSLISALIDKNASASIYMYNKQLNVYVTMPIIVITGRLKASTINSDTMSGFEADWDITGATGEGVATPRTLAMINNGQVTDGTAYASMLSSELTIVWHPMP